MRTVTLRIVGHKCLISDFSTLLRKIRVLKIKKTQRTSVISVCTQVYVSIQLRIPSLRSRNVIKQVSTSFQCIEQSCL